MIVFSRVSILSFSKIFWEKTDETYYYSFVAKERKEKPFEKLRSTNETGSNRIYFLRGKKSYQNMSDFYIRIFPRCFLITSETSTTDIYIYIYLNTWNIFLSSCPSISRLKWKREQLKRTIEEYLTFDLFSFPFPESASFAAIANVLLVRFDSPLTCETPIFLELSTYFLYI